MKRSDIVQLKSGGPLMTIQRFIGDPTHILIISAYDDKLKKGGFKDLDVMTTWFNGNKQDGGVFKADSLRIVSEEEIKEMQKQTAVAFLKTIKPKK